MPPWVSPIATLCAIFLYYFVLFLRYRPYDIDNPWFLSFSYDTFVEHIDSDQFMNMRFPGGMDGTQYFGKLPAALQYLSLAPFGWQQRPAELLSSLLVVLGLGAWWLQLRKLGFSRRFGFCFLAATGFSEPFLSVANKFRFEFFSFALISFALLLVAYGRPLLGAFVAALAVEAQPAALAGLIAVVILACSVRKPDWRLAAHLFLGAAGGGIVYLGLHPGILGAMHSLRHVPPVGGLHGGFFTAYFFDRPRHLPELLCFLIAAIVYCRRWRTMSSHYLALAALALTVFSILMSHGNASYIAFPYPFLVGMALAAFKADRRPWIVVSAVLLLFVPQQLFLIHLTRGLGLRRQDGDEVAKSIEAAAQTLRLPSGQLRVYGDYRLWFAHPHSYRAASIDTIESAQDADLYLCYERAPQPALLEPVGTLYCPALKNLVRLTLVSSLLVRNESVFLFSRQQPRR